MGLADRIRRFFAKKRNPEFPRLESFAREHKGVEGYVEPRTATSPTTLLLVDRAGEYLRGPVGEPEDAFAFCERLGIPVYDAAVIGYPRRMREFEAGRRAAGPDLDEKFEELERRLRDDDSPNAGG